MSWTTRLACSLAGYLPLRTVSKSSATMAAAGARSLDLDVATGAAEAKVRRWRGSQEWRGTAATAGLVVCS